MEEYCQKNKEIEWNEIDDVNLLASIHVFGLNDWKTISKYVGRDQIYCRIRWFKEMDPRIHQEVWTLEEDHSLLFFADSFEENWKYVARAMVYKTDKQCRSRYKLIHRKFQNSLKNRCQIMRVNTEASLSYFLL